MEMIKCLYHRLLYQLMTPACLQPALRSYVKSPKKSRSTTVLAVCNHSNKTPNDQTEPRLCRRKAKFLLLNAELQTGLSQSSAILVHPFLLPFSSTSSLFTEFAFLLKLSFFVFSLCADTRSVRHLFLMMHRLSGRVSLAKFDQTRSHL